MKRLLNCLAKDFLNMKKDDLIHAIKASEGRTILAETVVTVDPAIANLTNAELAKSAGADLILLNNFDTFNPIIKGLDTEKDTIKRLKELIGRPVGCNLEPIDENAKMLEERREIKTGRQVSKETLNRLNELGMDFICITGNPATGVTNNSINEAIKLAKKEFKGMIIAGKMHGAGSDEKIYDIEALLNFAKSGADVVLFPSVGTVPGSSLDKCIKINEEIKKMGVLTMGGLGTSQETSSIETIRQIGLYNKMVGFDISHIGDGGGR